MLKRKEILERDNSNNAVPLDYNIGTGLLEIEDLYQKERRENPMLEQTSPEAWVATVMLNEIREIRANVVIPDRTLSDAIQKYLRHHFPKTTVPVDAHEQQLLTTIKTCFPAIRSLFEELFDRGKSVFGILGLRASSGSIRRIVSATPKSKREQIIVAAIREKWSNRHLAEVLDTAGVRPRGDRWSSYMEMWHQDPNQFRVLKSQVGKKYLPKVGAKG